LSHDSAWSIERSKGCNSVIQCLLRCRKFCGQISSCQFFI